MNDTNLIRDRYLRDRVPIRLGGLAANLARASSCARNPANGLVVHGLIEESKWFIEWTAAELVLDAIETAAQLVQLQIELSRWEINWSIWWADPIERAQFGADAKAWSDRVMTMSGLLD